MYQNQKSSPSLCFPKIATQDPQDPASCGAFFNQSLSLGLGAGLMNSIAWQKWCKNGEHKKKNTTHPPCAF